MSLTTAQIIADADGRVPNGVALADKVGWLNYINQEFFEAVRSPLTESKSTSGGLPTYSFAGTIRERNITHVRVGAQRYESLNFNPEAAPGRNYFIFADATKVLTLSPAPLASAQTITLRYYRVGSTTFTAANIATDTPDAPDEYHWVYVLGLCERLAKAAQDVELAGNYAAEYQAGLMLAQRAYAKE